MASNPQWEYDQGLVDANNALLDRVNAQQVLLWEAERRCANAIRVLYGAAPWHATVSENDPLGYGLAELPTEAQMPWGGEVQRKDHCPKAAAVSVKRFVWDGLVVDGVWGTVQGLGLMVGVDGDGWSWDTVTETWGAMGGLIGYSGGEWSWGNARIYCEPQTRKLDVHLSRELVDAGDPERSPIRGIEYWLGDRAPKLGSPPKMRVAERRIGVGDGQNSRVRRGGKRRADSVAVTDREERGTVTRYFFSFDIPVHGPRRDVGVMRREDESSLKGDAVFERDRVWRFSSRLSDALEGYNDVDVREVSEEEEAAFMAKHFGDAGLLYAPTMPRPDRRTPLTP